MKDSIQTALHRKYHGLRMMNRVCSTKQEPIADMCVNLRIVERESVQQNENGFVKENVQASRALQMLSFDNFASMQYSLGADIIIEQIFDNVETKNVVIYGRAGIGKSTLCQYISVKWQKGELWSDKFNAVLWLPLRDIIGYQSLEEDAVLYLAEIIRHVCMSGFDLDKPSVSDIASYIFAPENAGKILVIFDGYDEAIHSMPEKLQDLVSMILDSERFCSILTSRPIAITLNKKSLTFDKELENVGFSQSNIITYIQKFYPQCSQELEELIDSNISLRSIAYIPLNLELICSVWASNPNLQQNCTLTQLYQEVIELMGKRMYAKPAFACSTERKPVVLEILSEIALLGMTERKSILDPKKVQEIINKKENELNVQNLFEEVLALGVLKIVTTNKDLKENPLYFTHHTFQEHFAGMKIVKGFEQYHVDEVDQKSLAMFKLVKYDTYYEKMLISVVGLLYANCNISGNYLPLFYFWDIFENEPRELLGNKHDTLKALLQNECPPIINPPQALTKLNNALINIERMLENIFYTIENGTNLEKCNAIEVLINLNITDQDLLQSVVSRLEKLVLKYYVKIKNLNIDCNDVIKLTVYLAYGLLSIGANSQDAWEILCKCYYYYIPAIRGPQGGTGAQEYNTDYDLYQTEALERLRTNNNVHTEIKTKIEQRLGQYQSKRIDLIRWFGKNDDNSGIVMMGYTAGLLIAAIIVPPTAPFSVLMLGGVTISTGISVWGITQSSLYQYYFQSTRELDTIYKSSDADRLKIICEKVNNRERVVLQWAREGMLNLLSAITLYSYSKQSAWLAPMKNIVFLYKDPSLIFTIQNRLIKNANTTLTSTPHQTKAVLAAMKEGYLQAKLDTKVLDHYINGASLDISGKEEKDAITKAKNALLRKRNGLNPMSFTPLHNAVAEGNLEEVKRIVESGEVDINDFQNEAWETPLVLAIKGKHWPIVEYLVENGADVNLGGALRMSLDTIPPISPLRNKVLISRKIAIDTQCFLSALNIAIEDYRMQDSPASRNTVLNCLTYFFTGVNRETKSTKSYDIYRLYLGNIKSILRERLGKITPSEAIAPDVLLPMRISIYLELYIKVATGKIEDCPTLDNAQALDISSVLSKLCKEIEVMINTYNTAISSREIISDLDLRAEYNMQIIQLLAILETGDEYVILSGASSSAEGHAIYVALHKLSDSQIIIRIDNRMLLGRADRAVHGCAPYNMSLGSHAQIKSYCRAILDLEKDTKSLINYINDLLNYVRPHEVMLPTIYQKHLSTVKYEDFSVDIKYAIDSWPYHCIQEQGTDNCVLSSYNLGISVRQGMEFFEWLIAKEQQLAPPLTTTHTINNTINQEQGNARR